MGQFATSTSIVTITDSRFLLAVYVLLASLRYHDVRSKITVLAKGLNAKEKALLEQFEDVRIVDSQSSGNRNPCNLKGEAILAAEADGTEYIALLDGDCIVTGNITPYLSPTERGFYSVEKTPENLSAIYERRYEAGDEPGTIPKRVLQKWQEDVGEKSEPATCGHRASGNLIIHRSHLNFVRKWQAQIMRVLPDLDKGSAHDFSSFAYQQTDESVLNSLLFFASDAPTTYASMFDRDPSAYVAHLGPYPKYWVMWSKEKLPYYGAVMTLFDWVQEHGYRTPKLTWCLKKRNKPLVYIVAYGHFAYRKLRNGSKHLLKYFNLY